MKVAIVHDDLLQWGGAERVVLALAQLWPEAEVFTSIADPDVVRKQFDTIPIHQSHLRFLPTVRKFRRAHFPLYPLAFQQFDFTDYDVVISSTTRFAHLIRKPAGIHVAYFHAPPRYVWKLDDYLAHESHGRSKRMIIKPITQRLSVIDRHLTQQIPHMIANSQFIAKQLARVYNRKSAVIYPFVDTDLFTPPKRQKASDDYYLIVSRLVAWKRIDIAIEACKKINKHLLIVGKGPDLDRLKKLAVGTKTEFIQNVTDTELVTYYQNCKALLLPQEEDFGLSALEAQACGRPVIAYASGGALETVIDKQTGLFFTVQSADALARTMKRFEQIELSSKRSRANAMRFTKRRFQKRMMTYITQIVHNIS